MLEAVWIAALVATGASGLAESVRWHVAPDGDDAHPGTAEAPLRTINAAAQKAYPGDTIIVHAGTYREEVVPPRGGEEGKPITYQAAPGEEVFIKGSDFYQGEWAPTAQAGVWEARLEGIVSPDFNPYRLRFEDTFPGHRDNMPGAFPQRTRGQVFVDGRMLDEVDREADLMARPGTWKAGEEGRSLRVHFPVEVVDPSRHQVEITVRKAVFRPEKRGLGYLVLRGFHLEHAANQGISKFWEAGFAPQQGLVSCRSGHHWIIEHNTIRYAKSIGIDVGSEGRPESLDGQVTPKLVGYHLIRGNVISDNGQCGLCGLGHIGTQIIGNVFERNNNLGVVAWEEAAIKTHFYLNGRIEGNLIRNNYTTGIWLDNVYQNVRITRNVILGNKGFGGVFCEMGSGPCLIDNNIIGLSTEGDGGAGGNGVYAHDAGGVVVAHNLLIGNANYGVYMRVVSERSNMVFPADIESFEQKAIGSVPCHCSHNRILNNILVGNHRGAMNLPSPGPKAEDNHSEGNLFDGQGATVLFGVNTEGGATAEQILQALAKAEEAHPVPASERFQPLPWGAGFWITFSQWQILMDADRHSQLATLSNAGWQILHPGPGPHLNFRIDLAPAEMQCDPVEGVDRDFDGQPIPREHPVPGPFQTMAQAGAYHFLLWPMEVGQSSGAAPLEETVPHRQGAP